MKRCLKAFGSRSLLVLVAAVGLCVGVAGYLFGDPCYKRCYEVECYIYRTGGWPCWATPGHASCPPNVQPMWGSGTEDGTECEDHEELIPFYNCQNCTGRCGWYDEEEADYCRGCIRELFDVSEHGCTGTATG